MAAPRRNERRGGFPGGAVAPLISLAILLFLGLALSRTVSATATMAVEEARADRLLTLPAVLQQGNLPSTFSYGGVSWQAVRLTRVGPLRPLERVDRLADGYPLYRLQGETQKPYPVLYLPARIGRTGLFVRYEAR
ncbi:MAG: hypothetical protein HY321_19840 [Armatimonadetes bacterium]|nr:hypothetical protein [Armatimonadota bacterium]